MERNIPHVLDIFVSSPGERRRILAKEREEEKFARQLKDQQKNPGSDSAVCLCSSSDEDERNISRYFDYLNDDDELEATSFNPKKKKSSKTGPEKKGPHDGGEDPSSQQKPQKKSKEAAGDKESARVELEKDIKQIERHLSMKKTIRKKMMRDLQQAFVEDPKEFKQEAECIPPERKNNINIQNLTISKRRLSKSEHSFLDMLKENEHKEHKDRKSYGRSATSESKAHKNYAHSHSKRSATSSSSSSSSSRNKHHEDDSGNDSPTREGGTPSHHAKHPKEKAPLPPPKEEKKASFWQRITGKGKSKR